MPRRLLNAVIVLIFGILVSACSIWQTFQSGGTRNSTEKQIQKDKVADDDIEFAYFFRGFQPVNQDREKDYLYGTYVINSLDGWSEYQGHYVPGIYYYLPLDFSKYDLVADAVDPRQPGFAKEEKVKACYIKNNRIVLKETELSNPVYDFAADNWKLVYVNVIRIRKNAVPKDLKKVFVYSER